MWSKFYYKGEFYPTFYALVWHSILSVLQNNQTAYLTKISYYWCFLADWDFPHEMKMAIFRH